MINPEQVPTVANGYRFQWEAAQNCYVLLYPEGMIKLNGSAGEIMQRCDGQRSISAIIAELKQAFPQAGDLSADVNDFFRVANENGWLEFK